MKYFLFLFTCLVIVACEVTEKPKQQDMTTHLPADIPNDTVQVVHMNADTNKLLLMGRGSEPGWICQFFQTKVRFIYDNGTDSLILRGFDFSNQMRMQNGFENFKLESPGKDTAFITLPGPCKEETTGEERAMKMKITLGKKTFKGCAWVPN